MTDTKMIKKFISPNSKLKSLNCVVINVLAFFFQIKDICYDLKLPLSASLQNQILVHCEDSNGDGQYKWVMSECL